MLEKDNADAELLFATKGLISGPEKGTVEALSVPEVLFGVIEGGVRLAAAGALLAGAGVLVLAEGVLGTPRALKRGRRC